jgi:hypothetical protein
MPRKNDVDPAAMPRTCRAACWQHRKVFAARRPKGGCTAISQGICAGICAACSRAVANCCGHAAVCRSRYGGKCSRNAAARSPDMVAGDLKVPDFYGIWIGEVFLQRRGIALASPSTSGVAQAHPASLGGTRTDGQGVDIPSLRGLSLRAFRNLTGTFCSCSEKADSTDAFVGYQRGWHTTNGSVGNSGM